MKPSYGAVSRYGLIDLSMSLDQIGVLAKNVDDAMLLFEVIAGKDEKDTMSQDIKAINIKKTDKVRVGVVKLKGVDPQIQKLVDAHVVELAKKNNWNIKEIKLEHIDLAVQTYYPLVYSEFYSATRKFDGRRYGFKIEEKCGKEILRRILGGSEITKAEHTGEYYRKALEVKEVIAQEFVKAFEEVDCIVMPVTPVLPWKIGEGNRMSVEEVYASDALTIPANLAGICSVVVPAGKVEGIPVGMQVMCGQGEDRKALVIAGKMERS